MTNLLNLFKEQMKQYIEEDGLDKDVANNMYLAIKEDDIITSHISLRMSHEDNGYNDSFDGFSYVPTTGMELDEAVDGCSYDSGTEVKHQIETAEFFILLVDAYQDQDDFFNYDSPRGEDTWHSSILCVAK